MEKSVRSEYEIHETRKDTTRQTKWFSTRAINHFATLESVERVDRSSRQRGRR